MAGEIETKASKLGRAAVEAELESVETATLADVRNAALEFASVLARAGASAHMTAARDRLDDIMQFASAHFGIKA